MNRRGFLRTLMLAPFVAPLAVAIVKKLATTPVKAPHWFTQMCAGYKGSQFLEAGVVYAPYFPLFQTCHLVNNPEFAKRYAETTINKQFYKKVTICG